MKKKNNWVFYFFIILFTAILSFQLVWRLTPIKDEIQLSLEERLRPFLGEQFKMSDFSLGFGYISFYDISVNGNHHQYNLHLDEVRIGYSIHKLLLHHLDPLQVIESVTFKNPRLLVYLNKRNRNSTTPDDSVDIGRLLLGFRKFAEIDRIFVQDGRLFWQRDSVPPTPGFAGLNGMILVKPTRQAELVLTGRVFNSDEPNLHIRGLLDFRKRTWDFDVDIARTHVQEHLPILNSPAFFLKEADVQGQLHLSSPDFSVRSLAMAGSLHVSRMFATSFEQQIHARDFYLIFQGQEMVLSPVAGTAQDGRFVMHGSLGSIFHPELNLSVDFDNYSAKNLVISVPILELLNRGKLQGHVELVGAPKNLVIRGSIYSSEMYYAFVPFYRTRLDFLYNNTSKLWRWNRIVSHAIGMDHHGYGQLDFNTMTMRLTLDSQRQIDRGVVPVLDRLNRTLMHYHTTMKGDINSLTFSGNMRSQFTTEDGDTVLRGLLAYKLVDDSLEVHSLSTAPGNWQVDARITNLWEDPTFQIMELRDVPLDSLSTFALVQTISRRFRADFYFSGPVNFPTAKVNFIRRTSGDVFFSLIGNAVNLIQPPFKFQGRFSMRTSPQRIHGNFAIVDKKNYLHARLKANRLLTLTADISYQKDGPVKGEMELQDIALKQFVGNFPDLYTAISEGKIGGKAIFSGTTGDPRIEFTLYGKGFILNQNGYYAANFRGEFNHSRLTFQQAEVTYNNRPILTADFSMDLLRDHLSAYIRGEGIESNFLATTIFNNPDLIRGELEYEVNMDGTVAHPEIWGTIILKDGLVLERPYHTINIIFTDSIPPTSTLTRIQEHAFRIQKFIYVDPNEYSIEGGGLLPVDAGAPLDLQLSVKGNVLAELPAIIDFFQEPDCLGELDMHITGTRENPHLQAGRLLIYNGTMKFTSVIPPLTGLKADIELREGDHFVHIHNLEGKLLNRHVKIYNLTAQEVSAGKKLEPWFFEDLGLNFGVLVMETDPRGIPLSIPGLMMPNDIGYFAVSGKVPGEKFYFAGPVELPHVRGKVTLYECRVTYPFLETAATEEEETDVVTEFLMNIDWDVLVESGMGNRYFADVPAFLDDVYLDLNIDEASRGLEFTGRLVDESLRVLGQVESTRGRVEYLDMNFRVDRFGAIFNGFEIYPEVYGRAWTTVRDSTNFPRDIYLVLYAIDPETGKEVSRGRWEDFRFKLESSDPTIGETQKEVLAYLGYSVENMGKKAREIGLTLTENYLFRPLVRPLERKLERKLGLDYVHLQSNFSTNLLYFGLHNRFNTIEAPYSYTSSLNSNLNPALLLLQSSQITLGKYLVRNLYMTYSGQLVAVYDEPRLGLNHRFALEYRLLRNLLLEVEYDKFQFDPVYYNRNRLQDFKIRFRHSFNF